MLLKRLGGLREDANIKDVNLAYKLEDGMKVYIPTNEEQEQQKQEQQVQVQGQEQAQVQVKGDSITSGVTKNTKININTATQEQLESLPGIGPSTAIKIINYRNENGKFKKIEDIKEVSGIGDAKFNKIKDFIVVK